MTNISVRSSNSIFIKIRKKIAHKREHVFPFNDVIELDESYFETRRVRGASCKTIVFGLLKRETNVYTKIVPDCSKAVLQGIIRGHIELESVINTDGWRGYDDLVDIGFNKPLRVNHGDNEFACGDGILTILNHFAAMLKNV